jgi:hypothetical protein
VLNHFQDIVVTFSIVTSMANIAMRGVIMKEEPITVSHVSKFYVSIVESIFVILLTKMALPLLMLSSMFSWIDELTKSRLFGWKYH